MIESAFDIVIYNVRSGRRRGSRGGREKEKEEETKNEKCKWQRPPGLYSESEGLHYPLWCLVAVTDCLSVSKPKCLFCLPLWTLDDNLFLIYKAAASRVCESRKEHKDKLTLLDQTILTNHDVLCFLPPVEPASLIFLGRKRTGLHF